MLWVGVAGSQGGKLRKQRVGKSGGGLNPRGQTGTRVSVSRLLTSVVPPPPLPLSPTARAPAPAPAPRGRRRTDFRQRVELLPPRLVSWVERAGVRHAPVVISGVLWSIEKWWLVHFPLLNLNPKLDADMEGTSRTTRSTELI